MLGTAFVVLLGALVFSLFTKVAEAQPVPSFFLPTELKSKNGDESITLIFVSLEDKNAVFMRKDGAIIRTSLGDFSTASARWIQDAAKQQKQLYSRIEEIKEESSKLQSTSASRRKAFFKLLAKNQDVGWVLEQELADFISSAETAEERFMGLCGFAFVARNCERNFNLVMHFLTGKDKEVMEILQSNPDQLLPSVGRFADRAIPYLKHAASTGNPIIENDKKFKFVAKPVAFRKLNTPENRVRAAAALALGVPRADSPQIANFLGELFDTVMKVRIAGKYDLPTLRATVVAIGENGTNYTRHMMRMERAAKFFPKEVEVVLQRFKETENRVESIEHLNINRFFVDKNGQELVFGRVMKESGDKYIFLDFMNQVVQKKRQLFDKAEKLFIEKALKKVAETEKPQPEK